MKLVRRNYVTHLSERVSDLGGYDPSKDYVMIEALAERLRREKYRRIEILAGQAIEAELREATPGSEKTEVEALESWPGGGFC